MSAKTPTRVPATRESTAQRLLYDVASASFQLGGLSVREIKRRFKLPDSHPDRLAPTRIGKRVFVSHATIVAYIADHTEAET